MKYTQLHFPPLITIIITIAVADVVVIIVFTTVIIAVIVAVIQGDDYLIEADPGIC